MILVRAEFADGENGALGDERRNDDVDTRTIGEARVDVRRRLVDAPAERGDDALDDAHDVQIVAEAVRRDVNNTVALVVNLVWGVDHDFGDRRVVQERLNGPIADGLVDDELQDGFAVLAEERRMPLREQLARRHGDGFARAVSR